MNLENKFFGKMAPLVGLGLVGAAFGLMWAYLPPYSWIAELQLAIMGEYYEGITLLLTAATLMFAVIAILVASKILWKTVPRAACVQHGGPARNRGSQLAALAGSRSRHDYPGRFGIRGIWRPRILHGSTSRNPDRTGPEPTGIRASIRSALCAHTWHCPGERNRYLWQQRTWHECLHALGIRQKKIPAHGIRKDPNRRCRERPD